MSPETRATLGYLSGMIPFVAIFIFLDYIQRTS